jgi:putative transposase
VRRQAGRKTTPSAAIVDSQGVTTTEEGGPRGDAAGKQVAGRKRHLVVAQLRGHVPWLQLRWADGGYAGKLVDWVKETCGRVLTIVKRSDAVSGCQVLPKRWIVARTCAWLGRSLRLSKDDEATTERSAAWVTIAMLHLMIRRLAPH